MALKIHDDIEHIIIHEPCILAKITCENDYNQIVNQADYKIKPSYNGTGIYIFTLVHLTSGVYIGSHRKIMDIEINKIKTLVQDKKS